MRIHITDAGAITMLEPANFRGLDVLIDPQPEDRLTRQIARIGRREGDGHIRIAPGVLRFLSPLAGDPGWDAGFDAMIAYAAKAGWVDDAGAVRAHITWSDPPAAIDPDDFRRTLRRLAAGVCAVTTGTPANPAGLVASSVVSISAEPPLVGVFVNGASSALPMILQNGLFAANVLGCRHADIVRDFLAQPQGSRRFGDADWQAGGLDLPVLASALAVMECRIVTTEALGTHRLLVGRIVQTATREYQPMVHFNGVTRRLEGEAA
ncbi:MAG: flavin reductase family protein [Rhodobacterales bacterium]|nr:flavin reductase family protein [Rhodobacterales bacterium]MDX5499224.1 flavin reductase family protein [Rhodobacterales bacterium]